MIAEESAACVSRGSAADGGEHTSYKDALAIDEGGFVAVEDT